MSVQDRKTILEDLGDRRFFQFAFSYLVGGFAIIQFVEWLSGRYDFSRNWTDITFFFLIAILPSVLIFIYYHGESGLQKFNKLEKRFIPANVIGALALIFFLFKGTSLPAESQAEKVTVVNEEGEKLERLIPLSAQTKRLVLFPLEDLNNPQDPNWLPINLPVLQAADLEQDNRLFSFSSFDLRYEYDQKGLTAGTKTPLSTYRKIAQEYLTDYFMKGSLEQKGNTYLLEVELYSSHDGKEFLKKSYEGDDIFKIVDQISVDFREALFLSETEKKDHYQVVDLPAADQFTANFEALRNYFEGKMAIAKNDLEEGSTLLKRAVELDPNFAEAHLSLGINQYNVQELKEGETSLAKAVSLSNDLGLPERQQFNIRYFYYSYTNDNKKQEDLLKMWNQLYPNDYYPYFRLYNIYEDRREYPLAEEYALKALNKGHRARSLPRLASICSKQDKFDDALNYLRLFEEEYPHKAKVNPDMGRLYQKMGKFEKALSYFESTQLLKPDDPYTTGNIAFVHSDMGNMDKAEQLYLKALSQARIVQDSISCINWLTYFYTNLGKISKVEEYLWKNIELRSKVSNPSQAKNALLWYDHMHTFVENGEIEKYKGWIDDYVGEFYQDQPEAACVAYLSFAVAVKDKEQTRKYFEECGEAFGRMAGANFLYLFKGMLAEMEEDYPEMIVNMEAFLKRTNSNEYFFEMFLGRAYRKNKQTKESYELLSEMLVTNPYVPWVRMELAQTCLEMNKKEEAIEHLKIACEIWKDADPSYIPAQEAKALLAASI